MRLNTCLALLLGGLGSAALAEGDGIQTGATLELNYTHSFNRPASNNSALGAPRLSNNRTGYFFNRKEGTFALNLAEVRLSKEATRDNRVGFSLRLIDGDAARMLAINSENVRNGIGDSDSQAAARSRAEVIGGAIGSDSVANFYEAYVRTIPRDNLTVDLGVFPSWIGIETVALGSGNFFSRSFHYGQFQPRYHGGLRVSMPSGDDTTFTATVVNAYNGVDRSGRSRDLGLGFQVARKLTDTASIRVNGLSARDVAIGGGKHDIFNVVYTNQLSESTSMALDASYTTAKPGGAAVRGTAFTGYLTSKLSNGNMLGLRGELVQENRVGGGLLPLGGGRKPSVSSITASYELVNDKIKGVRTLIEARLDNANVAVFPSRSGNKKHQTTLTLSQVFNF